jgi:hypothetical protein
MFGINQVFRAKEGLPPLYRSGGSGMNGQNLPHGIFTEDKNMFPRKSQVIGVFLVDQPPFAILLNGIGGGDKTVPGKNILPVINSQNGLEIGQWDKGMQRGIRCPVSVFHAERVSLFVWSINGTNLQNAKIL